MGPNATPMPYRLPGWVAPPPGAPAAPRAAPIPIAPAQDARKFVPLAPGKAGPKDLTQAEKDRVAALKRLNIVTPKGYDPGPLPEAPQDSTLSVSGGMPSVIIPPGQAPADTAPPVIPAVKPSGGGGVRLEAVPAQAAPVDREAILAQYRSALPESGDFRKAGIMDALQAVFSGISGKESEYARQRAEWQARQDALMAAAQEENSRLSLMEAQAAIDAQSAATDNQARAAESARNRNLSREEINARLQADRDAKAADSGGFDQLLKLFLERGGAPQTMPGGR